MDLRGSESRVHFLVTVVRKISRDWACFYLKNNEERVSIQTLLHSCSRPLISPHPPIFYLTHFSLSLHRNVKACEVYHQFFFFLWHYKVGVRCGIAAMLKCQTHGVPRFRQVRSLTKELCCWASLYCSNSVILIMCFLKTCTDTRPGSLPG